VRIAFALAFLASPALADPTNRNLIPFGERAAMLGNAGITSPLGESVFYNPANLRRVGHANPYFFYSPRGNFQIPDADEHQLGVGHTKGYAPGDYFVELRAKRAGVVVGRSESSMIMDDQNSAIRISHDDITITDR
jgi:hypothetical protein